MYTRLISRTFAAAIVVALLATPAFAGPDIAVTVSPEATIIPINPYLFKAIDENGSWDLTEAMEQEYTPSLNNQYFGTTNATVWLKFKIYNNSDTQTSLFLELDNPTISYFKVYQLREEALPIADEVGAMVAFNKKPFAFRNPTVKIQIPPRQTMRIFIRSAAGHTLNLPIFLKSLEAIKKENAIINKAFGFYFGSIFIILALCIIMYFLQRNSSYIYYFGLITCLHAGLLPWMFGVNHSYILPNTDNVADYFTRLAQVAIILIFTLFVNQLFKNSKTSLPRFYLPTIIAICFVYSIKVIVLGPSTLQAYVLRPLLIIAIPASLLIAWNNSKEGSTASGLYLLSWIGIFSIVFTWTISGQGLIGMAASRMIILIGCLFQAITLFMAMLVNIKTIQDDNLAAQKYIKKIDRILNHLHYGLLTFDENLSIDPQFSAFLTKVYELDNTSIAGKNIMLFAFQGMGLSTEELNQIRDSLRKCFGKSRSYWNAEEHKLPRQFTMQIKGETKIISMSWAPILNESGKIKRIMLTIDDLTEQHHLEKESAAVKKHQRRLLTTISELISQDSQQISQYLTGSIRRLAKVQTNLDQTHELTGLATELKAIRSGAQILQARNIIATISTTEIKYKNYISGRTKNRHELIEAVSQLDAELKHYCQVYKDFLSDSKSHTIFPENTTLVKIVATSIQKILYQTTPNQYILNSMLCKDQILHWKKDYLPDIANIILHGISHCIENGYSLTSNQDSNQKILDLAVVAFKNRNRVFIIIKDKSPWLQSLDMDQIAKENDWPANSSDDNLLDLLLADILSQTYTQSFLPKTAKGLEAIKDIAHKTGGHLKIRRNKPEGTKLVIELSAKQFVEENDLEPTVDAIAS